MGTTLSPFRYIQLARYVVNKWLDQAPLAGAKWKGKGKAKPLLRGAAGVTARGGVVNYAVNTDTTTNNGSNDRTGLASTAGAGPSTSRTPLTPDPRMPAQSTEIYRLMNDERLLGRSRDNAPKEIIVLCHGESRYRCHAKQYWADESRTLRLLYRHPNTPISFVETPLLGIRLRSP